MNDIYIYIFFLNSQAINIKIKEMYIQHYNAVCAVSNYSFMIGVSDYILRIT